jgi:4-amino-4-deoxy-L-arabinose transferase-like glycosyltransferase
MVAVLGLALLAAGALAIALALRLGLAATALVVYVAASAEIVLGAEVLSPFHAIGRGGYLGWEALVASLAIAAWLRAGRPRPPLPRVTLASLRRHPTLVVLGLVVGVALLFEIFLCVDVAPDNWDALTYHLSRAAAWYQHGSLGFFAAHTPRENIYPGNAEIQILFTMVFTRGDRLAAFPQFLAQLALLVGIFGIARRLGFRVADAMFASLLFATLSEVVLEATTEQNDLVVSACVVAGAFFLLGSRRREHIVGAVALGLALGTKLTAIYAVPILALLALSMLPRRRVFEFAGASLVAFAIFGSLVYVENTIHYGTPLGPSSARQQFTPTITAANTVSTTMRTLYRFADLSGLNARLDTPVSLDAVGKFAFGKLDIDPEPAGATQNKFFFPANTRANEDLSYFGPLGALFLLPLAFGYLGAFVLRRASRVKFAFALALPVFAVELALTYKYNEWLGRFMIVPVALAAALLARTYAVRFVAPFGAVLGILFLALALVHNERKPVGLNGSTPAWSLSRAAGEGLVTGSDLQLFHTFDSIVPSRARVGLLFGDDDWDYPLYGPHLTRQLVVLPSQRPFAQADSLHLDWVVVGDVPWQRARGWTEANLGTWKILAPDGSAAAKRIAAYERSIAVSSL